MGRRIAGRKIEMLLQAEGELRQRRGVNLLHNQVLARGQNALRAAENQTHLLL